LLVTVKFPATLPADVGAKVTVSVIDCPAVIVCGDFTPPELKPVPEIDSCETVIVEFSLFVSVTFCVFVLPTFTFPKPNAVGTAFSPGGGATPVPLRVITVGEVGALLVSESEPTTVLELAGVKTTLIVPDPPAVTVMGNESWLVLNPAAPVN